jgi:hypothetical protein
LNVAGLNLDKSSKHSRVKETLPSSHHFLKRLLGIISHLVGNFLQPSVELTYRAAANLQSCYRRILVLLTDLPGLPLSRSSQVCVFVIRTLSFAILTLSLRHDNTSYVLLFILNAKAGQRISLPRNFFAEAVGDANARTLHHSHCATDHGA